MPNVIPSPLLHLTRRAWMTRTASAGLSVALVPSLSACAATPLVYDMAISRDAGCGCCKGWTVLMNRTGRFRTTLTNEPDMAGLKARLGVPEDLHSCHTGIVESFVIEGHVPAEDILKLLAQRPKNVRGLAVPGMPLGSPGMEQSDGAGEPFDVFAFGAGGAKFVFAHHA